MKLYLMIIGFAMLHIAAGNIIFNTARWYVVIFLVILCTVLQFALDGLIAVIINKMKDYYFYVENPLYHVTEAEIKLYKRLNVHEWKDKVWELGGMGGFSKKNFLDPGSMEYIERFIIECNKGVLTHRLSYAVGFLPMLFITNNCAWTIAFPIALVNMFLNILPTIVLRYNTPKLKRILQKIKRKEKMEEK